MTAQHEAEIRRIGEAIFGGMPKESPSVFRKDFWNGKIMEWSMRDEAFKVEMFRFVDVFPVLQTPESTARHIQEYFCRPEQDFPAWIQLGMKSVSSSSIIAKTAAKQIEKNIKGMAYGFVAGEDANEALPRIVKMRKQGLAFTVDLLGESTVSEAEADAYQQRYTELIDTLADAAAGWAPDALLDQDAHGPIPRVNVSIKISALFSQLDPLDLDGSIAGIKRRLLPLFEQAHRRGVFLNLDMEQYEVKDLTLALFKSLLLEPSLRAYEHAGVVIQAYLRDSLNDVHALCAWARQQGRRVTVRLVKGAYWDYETIHAQQHGWPIPVYQNKWETDANYEACARVLLDHHDVVRTSIASHNVRSMAAAMAYAEALGIPKAGLEIQMLYGMAEPMKQSLRGMGYRVRDYVPVGELVPGMAYLVRRLLENTSNEGFLRAKFAENRDSETLLRAPTSAGRDVVDPSPSSQFLNEAHTDFARADRRQAFATALERVRGELGRHYELVIGTERRRGETAIYSYNPSRSAELVGTVACASREDAEHAIRTAYGAFPEWRDTPVEARAALLRRLADELRRQRDTLSAWMVLEVGKSWREADADTAEAIDFCDYYADEAIRLMTPTVLGRYPGEANTLFTQPMGVGVVIAPWNFPLAILCGMTVAAAVTGNCVIMKPAEQSPVIAAKLMEAMQAAGFPPGVVSYLPGIGEDVGAHLVDHAWTRFIAFTGSRDVGLHILKSAYTTLPTQPGVKRVICEMGGKNAIIVDDDADLDEAVKAVVHSAFGFQGQKCSACSRVIVLPDNYDAFVERLVEATRSLPIGASDDPAYGVGPVIDAEALAKVQAYIAIGREEGTELLVRDVPTGGHFAPLAIFADIEVTHRLAQEEVFGPVLAVMRARDFGHALEIANSTSYALTGGVISRSPANLERARREFRVGNLYINRGCTGALVYRQPFGGFKFSGIGAKAGGPHYLHQFVEERAVSENTMRRGFAPDLG
jgi:RHH-type transcriptional regulator, proline utilization regulon repressor / proline dehydrogenase / delta 1-pyrroline-5-carboxylate dehydrogenase